MKRIILIGFWSGYSFVVKNQKTDKIVMIFVSDREAKEYFEDDDRYVLFDQDNESG